MKFPYGFYFHLWRKSPTHDVTNFMSFLIMTQYNANSHGNYEQQMHAPETSTKWQQDSWPGQVRKNAVNMQMSSAF